jgi:hypothetical protein
MAELAEIETLVERPAPDEDVFPPGLELGLYPGYAGGDVDCPDPGYSVLVDGSDPHGLDRDNDGIGCDSYLGRPIPDHARLSAPD